MEKSIIEKNQRQINQCGFDFIKKFAEVSKNNIQVCFLKLDTFQLLCHWKISISTRC